MINNCSDYSGNTCVKCGGESILINGVCVNPPANCFLYDKKTA